MTTTKRKIYGYLIQRHDGYFLCRDGRFRMFCFNADDFKVYRHYKTALRIAERHGHATPSGSWESATLLHIYHGDAITASGEIIRGEF